MKNKKEIDIIVGVIESYSIADDADHVYLTLCEEAFEKVATEILIKLKENERVIFKAKLTKGVNLSKVIEQVLYPKYIDKEIIIRVVKR